MTQAGLHAGHDPDRASFVEALQIPAGPSPTKALPPPARPRRSERVWQSFLHKLLARLNRAGGDGSIPRHQT